MERRNFVKNTLVAGLALSYAPVFSFETKTKGKLPAIGSQPFRQIHLDFHTSGFIENVAKDFDADIFANTLEKARVNSINCFAKCHHGWLYYNSKRFPELVHPHLKTDLLERQVEALKKRDIKVIGYVSLQADYQSAKNHSDWRLVDPDGSLQGGSFGTPHFWKMLCLNTPYVDFLKEQIRDVSESVVVDGFWLDIIAPRDCSCKNCKERMLKHNLNQLDENDRMINAEGVMEEFMKDMSAFIRDINPNYLIYYNSGHITPLHRRAEKSFSHFELESLASSQKWGYPFFQSEARYARNLGKEMVGMTGKFHSVWGDFHSFKNKYALEFDCFQSLALNGKCCVGDQLHPSGKLDPYTYELIGSVYEQVEKKEPWCHEAKAITEIGVFTIEEFTLGIKLDHPDGLWGANRMLLESGFQYDVLDSKCDFSAYKLLILPDAIPVEGEFKVKLENYLLSGGKIILSFESGMNRNKSQFVDFAGVKPEASGNSGEFSGKVTGNNNYAQYLIPQGQIGKGLNPTEYVMHIRGLDVKAKDNSEVLLNNVLSYFDREGEHFCSHLQTPSSGKTGLPAVVRSGNVIYFSHPIFKQYNFNASPWCKTLLVNAIDMLMPERLVRTNGPTSLITSLNTQESEKRKVLHLLHYIPQQRGLDFQTIEEAIPLYNLEVEVLSAQKVSSVKMVPQNVPVKYDQKDSKISFILDKIVGHQMVEIK